MESFKSRASAENSNKAAVIECSARVQADQGVNTMGGVGR